MRSSFRGFGSRAGTRRGTIKDDDVKLLFPLLAEQRKDRELQFLGGVCRSKWGIRGAVNVYRNAVDNDDISYNSLYARARNMGIVII